MSLLKEEKISSLDELRGLAALMVLIYHLYQSFFRGIPNYSKDGDLVFPETFNPYFNFLNEFNAGVNLFFVLSGFLIHYIYSKSDFNKSQFLSFTGKRFIRIIPPYYFSLLVATIGGLAIGYFDVNPLDIVYHVLFINNLTPKYAFTIQAVYWSIAVEIQFYILYAIYRYLTDSINIRHKLFYFFGFTLIISVVYKIILYQNTTNLAGLRWEMLFNTIIRFPEWIIGALAFEYRSYLVKLKYKFPLFVVIVVITVMLNNYFIYHLLICDLLYAIAFGLLILYTTSEKFSFAPLNFLGKISYSMYLNHFLIYSVWDTCLVKLFRLPRVASFERFFIQFSGLFVAILGSYILYKLIEEPGQKLKSKLSVTSIFGRRPA